MFFEPAAVHSLKPPMKWREGRSLSRMKGTINNLPTTDCKTSSNNLAKDSEVRLRSAAITGDIGTVRWCIDVEGTNVNCAGSRGSTPLHWASEKGHFDIVQFLLSRGANVELTDDGDNTPLIASIGRNLDVAQILLEHGANVNARDRVLFTPLHWASHLGDVEMVYLLISYGADLNARTSVGQLPIDVAKAEQMRQMLKQAMFVEPTMDSRACVTTANLQ